jgi:branched-chain amino acid aminotransferase
VVVDANAKVWWNGRLMSYGEARVGLLTHTLHYGLGVFEGIRAYEGPAGGAVFRLREHLQRLLRSAHIMELALPYDLDQLERAALDTLRANGMRQGYIRPIAWLGEGSMGLLPANNPVEVAILVWNWGAYLGAEGLERGIRAKVSSYTRHHPNINMTQAKSVGGYINSILAKREVTRLGYDEAIMLDPTGMVAEASGENIFIVRNGVLKTPPLGSVLEGITRDAVIQIARDKGIGVIEQPFTRDELYVADEAFMTGTAAEITPVREVDDRKIGAGARGPVTRAIQTTFFEAVRGNERKYESWLTRV